MSTTVKVKVLRTVQRGELYLKKSEAIVEIPSDLATELAKGAKPAVEIQKGK